MRSAVPAELRQGGLGLLRALLAGRTRGAALTALLDARLKAENHFTLLTIAARHGQADAVRLLLESGASVGATTGGGSTALAIACQQGHLECVQLLLQAHAAVDQANANGATPLFIASKNGHVDVLRLLLTADLAVDQAMDGGFTPLYVACEKGHVDIARLLLDTGAAVGQAEDTGVTPLCIACEEGRLECVQLLLGAGAAVNQAKDDGTTPLSAASLAGQIDCVRLLIAAGAAVNQADADGFTPLLVACQEGHLVIARLLLGAGAAVTQATEDGATPLYIACEKDHVGIARLLLKASTAVNQAMDDGTTPLYVACFKGHLDVVQLLLGAGAAVDQADEDGVTPLYVACQEGHPKIARLLLEASAASNQATGCGFTPLHVACQNGHLGIVQLLLEADAAVNQATDGGAMPLHTACIQGHPAVVLCLLRAGADTAARTSGGRTALQLAKKKGHTECVKALSEEAARREAAAAAAAAEGRAGAGGASSGAAAAAAVDAPLLGQRVVLSGLSARPELNGRRGVAQSFRLGRYVVALESSAECVRVRPTNLSRLEAESTAAEALPVAGLGSVAGDVAELVAKHIGEDDRFAAALSCRALRDALRRGAPRLHLKTHVASAVGSFPRLKWSLAVGCPRERLCELAAAQPGGRELIEYLQFVDGTCPWGKTCDVAASRGDVPLLEWAREGGAPWGVSTAAALAGHWSAFKPALEVSVGGVRFGSRNAVQPIARLLTLGCPADETCCAAAATLHGVAELSFLRSFDLPWDERTCSALAAAGNTEALKWAQEQDCPCDAALVSAALASAAAAGKLDVGRLLSSLDEQKAEVARLQPYEAAHAAAEAKCESAVLANLAKLPLYSRYQTARAVQLGDGDPTRALLVREFLKSRTRHRGPRQGDPHRSVPLFEVQRVEQLFNPRLQEKYLAELQDIAGLCERRVGPLPDIDARCTRIDVEAFPGLKLNERLLYHGAPSELIERLTRQGLDPRYAGGHFGKLFGAAVYLAANSSKSDIYTEPNAAGERCVLVARACLGEAHRAQEPMRDALKPPERPDGRGPLSSVAALTLQQGGVVEHPEFMVYQSSQCLPVFAIWYKHGAGCGCTHCWRP